MELGISRIHRNRLYASSGYADIEREVSQMLCPHSMEVLGRGPLHAELYGVSLHRATLLELHYGGATRIDAGDIADHYLFRTTLSGHCVLESGGERVELASGGLSVSSPQCTSTIITDPQCRNLLLRVDRGALEMRLAEMLQESVRHPIHFSLGVADTHAGSAIFRSTLRYLCELAQPLPMTPNQGIFGAEFMQWLLTLLLTQLPHSYSSALAKASPRPLPVHVRRARDYIEAHLAEPLRLNEIATAVGVSTRTLQNGFNQFLDTSPGDYIRERRLDAVHSALQEDTANSVTEILLAYGVHSFGHFAKAYTRRFGCLPSVTAKHYISN